MHSIKHGAISAVILQRQYQASSHYLTATILKSAHSRCYKQRAHRQIPIFIEHNLSKIWGKISVHTLWCIVLPLAQE
jgi:hypothetical protein